MPIWTPSADVLTPSRTPEVPWYRPERLSGVILVTFHSKRCYCQRHTPSSRLPTHQLRSWKSGHTLCHGGTTAS
eukprot:1919255-Pyramimonas_sp.AAC.1